MRCQLALLSTAVALLFAGCPGGSALITPGPEPSASVVGLNAGSELVAGHYAITLDPATLTATAHTLPSRGTQGYQALSFDLDITAFTKPDTFVVREVGLDADDDLVITFSHAHPFTAPNLLANPTSQNRADLGYTGRLLILADVASGDVPANTFFAGIPDGEAVANTTLVKSPDGYVPTGDLLAQSGLNADTFPYVLLADDAEDNRVGISNGSNLHGNYDDLPGGWQRATLGPNGSGWTGFDYVHAGQTIENTFTIDRDALASGPATIEVAILIKYTQPSGAPPRLNRALHFPQESASVTEFAYRLPFAALDMSVVTGTEEVDLVKTAGSTATLSFAVRDYDAMAFEAPDADLSDETDVTLVQPGAPGAPGTYDDEQLVSAAGVAAADLGAGTGWTLEAEGSSFSGLLTSTTGNLTEGSYRALIRVVDPENADGDAATYRFGVDPVTLANDPARALPRVTYQAFTLNVIGSLPPTITEVTPTGVAGASGALVNFSATATNSPTSWSWDFDGGAFPNTSTDASPQVTLEAPGAYNGTVTATNANGTSVPFNFNFLVTPPVVPSFANHPIAQTGNVGFHCSIAVYGGKLAIAYQDVTAGNLSMALANIAAPTTATDWTTHMVDDGSGTQVGLYNQVIVHDGKLGVVYYEGNPALDLRFAMANTATPVGVSSYNAYTLDGVGTNAGLECNAVEIGGYLAVSYRDITGGGIKYARATSFSPTLASQWVMHEVRNRTDADFAPTVPGSLFNGSRLINLNGNPAFTFSPSARGPWVAIAQTATPSTKPDWAVYNLEALTVVANHTASAAVSGRMAVAYQDGSGAFDVMDLAMATVSNPASMTDWTFHTVATGSIDQGDYPSMTVVDGRLVLTFVDNTNDDLMVARALAVYPDSASDWQLAAGISAPTLQYSRFHKGVVDLGGRIAFPAYEDTADDLVVGISSTTW